MFDIGWTELLLIGVVALIVIGPKDLPEMFRQLGRITAKIRSMGREFQRAMDQAAKESGVKDVARDLKAATSPKSMGLDAVKDAADRFEKWDPLKQVKTPAKATAGAAEPKLAAAPAGPAAGPAATDPAPAEAPAAPTEPAAQPIHGPATQALYDKQAAKKAVMAEATAKMRAIDAGAPAPADAARPARKSARKTVTAEPAAAPGDGDAARPARKPRKKAPEA